jgi:hypothetical protein
LAVAGIQDEPLGTSDRSLVFFFAVDIEGRNVSNPEIAIDSQQQRGGFSD